MPEITARLSTALADRYKLERHLGDNAAFGHDYVFGLLPLFRLDSEQSFSTWYSTLALAFSALLLFAIAREKLVRLDRFARHWLGLAGIFVFLSADEASSIHEKISLFMRSHVSAFGLVTG